MFFVLFRTAIVIHLEILGLVQLHSETNTRRRNAFFTPSPPLPSKHTTLTLHLHKIIKITLRDKGQSVQQEVQ